MDNMPLNLLPSRRAIPREKNDLLDDEAKALFDKTELGQSILREQEIFCKYENEPCCDAVIDYWLERGMVKRVFPADGERGEFSVLYPAGAENKPLPAVYVIRGRNHSPFFSETYGFGSFAAREKFMIITPASQRDPKLATGQLELILSFLPQQGIYPDEKRLYLFGFAAGSDGAAALALECPGRFAALSPNPGGRCFCIPPRTPQDGAIAKLRETGMPIICVGGTMDNDCVPKPGSTAEDFTSLNTWFSVTGAAMPAAGKESYNALSSQSAGDGENPRAALGLPFPRCYAASLSGAKMYVGEADDKSGRCVLKWARVEGLSHYVAPEGARMVWDFFKGFSR